jgi:hypothetical protein
MEFRRKEFRSDGVMECWGGGSGLLARSGLCCHMLKVGLVLRPRERRALDKKDAAEAEGRSAWFRTELLESCGKPVAPSAGRARLHPVCGRRIEAVS